MIARFFRSENGFKKRNWNEPEPVSWRTTAICKAVAIIAIATVLLLSQVNDSGMMYWFLFVLGLSLAYDFFFADNGIGTILFGIFALIIFIIALWMMIINAGTTNAVYFDSFIVKSTDFPIKNEVPNNMLRLTTEELANSIASQHMGEFGSAVKIVNTHLGIVDGRLYWLVTVANKESFGSTYRTTGMILVDANNPDNPVKVIKEKFNVAEGLDFPVIGTSGQTNAKGYFGIDSAKSYGDAYPVIDPNGKWYIALTAYTIDWKGVRHYDGVYQINQQGEVVNHYKDSIPSWMIKPYDENGFLEQGISDWGSHRRGNGFDLFAGGFLWSAPSNDRLELTEDTRFIYDPDTNQVTAMDMVNPIREKGILSSAGAFKTTSSGIIYYDLRSYDLMSGVAASGVVKSKITARSGSNYYTAMELLYPIKVDNQTRYAWFVPIYYQNQASGLIGLAGLGIVDAQSADKVVVEYTGDGLTGESLIEKTKGDFRALYAGNYTTIKNSTGTMIVNATLISKYDSYTKGGNTMQWIVINTQSGSREVLIDSSLLTDAEILEIQKLYIGDEIELKLGDNVIKQVYLKAKPIGLPFLYINKKSLSLPRLFFYF